MGNILVEDFTEALDFKKPSHILGMAWSDKWQILALTATDGRIFIY
jgi:hypothetical protein